MKHLSALFLLVLIAVSASAQRPAYYLNTNWVPQVKQEGTNTVTNMVGMITTEPVPLPVAAPAVPSATPDSDLGFIITTLTTIIASILALLAKWKGMQKDKLNTVMSQNFQVSREMVKTSAGPAAEAKLVEKLKSDQVEAGVKALAADISTNKVNTAKAKNTADEILAP